ncbi:hypothetical protein MTO96_033593, partial [Rhipicephalus appendiculatus]
SSLYRTRGKFYRGLVITARTSADLLSRSLAAKATAEKPEDGGDPICAFLPTTSSSRPFVPDVSQPGATILTIVMCVCLGVMISLLTVLAFTTAEIAYSRIVSRLIFRSANDNFLMQRQVCSKRQ